MARLIFGMDLYFARMRRGFTRGLRRRWIAALRRSVAAGPAQSAQPGRQSAGEARICGFYAQLLREKPFQRLP